MPLMKNLDPIRTDTAFVRSGMITPFGIILKVDRCAPEHGGGILVWFPLSRTGSHIEPDGHLHVFGTVYPTVLEQLRIGSTAVTNINYQNGIR
jgi:hypothetical protein